MSLKLLSSPVHIDCMGVLFDMDGILISSIASVDRSWTKWALMRGVDPAYAIRMAHGVRAIETVALLRPDLDPKTELDLIEEIELSDGDGLSVLPGVHALISALPPERWTVVTSATTRLASIRLAMAGIPVPTHFITAEHVVLGKPNPAPYLAGAALLGFKPEECVVFEDAESGTKSGRAAGCTVVATAFSHPIETLSAAHYLIETLEQVSVELNKNSLRLTLTPKPQTM
jgi:mannitol-1-/sugar-/sorbitol-6-phosphatase